MNCQESTVTIKQGLGIDDYMAFVSKQSNSDEGRLAISADDAYSAKNYTKAVDDYLALKRNRYFSESYNLAVSLAMTGRLSEAEDVCLQLIKQDKGQKYESEIAILYAHVLFGQEKGSEARALQKQLDPATIEEILSNNDFVGLADLVNKYPLVEAGQ